MKCTLIRWWMEEYIDGTLDSRRTRWVRGHLQECRACAQELAWRRSLQEVLKPGLVAAPPQQDMWQDFQRRLAGHVSADRTLGIARWQWGVATAAVVCALALGWWNGGSQTGAPPEPRGRQNLVSGERQGRSPMAGATEAPSPSAPTRSSAARPMHTAKALTARRPERSPSPVQAAARPSVQPAQQAQPPAPQVFASTAYAEVRNEQGELISRVFLQTTYDENGQPRAVEIELNTPTALEVEHGEQPMDSSDYHSDSHGSVDSPTPTAGARLGIPD